MRFLSILCVLQASRLRLSVSRAVDVHHSFRSDQIFFFNVSSIDCTNAFQAKVWTAVGDNKLSAARLGLVHRHGYCSPVITSTKNGERITASDLAAEMVKMDVKRIRFLQSKINGAPCTSDVATRTPVISGAGVGTGNYLLRIGLGTPARELTLVLDTGSELAWTQCIPCASAMACFSQIDAIFNPASSNSYKPVACGSSACNSLGSQSLGTCSPNGPCQYLIQYLDGSFTTGDFATDILSIGGKTVGNYAFGCGHDNEGLFVGMDGLLGMDKGGLSFLKQTVSTFGSAFAYCLPSPSTSAGFVEFGTAPSASRITPLIQAASNAPLYFVQIDGIAVGSTALSTATGAAIVDSGTVISRLASPIYTAVRDAFQKATAALTPAPAGSGQGLFDTCYTIPNGKTVQIPAITFKLMGGLDFSPPASNLLYPVDSVTYCLAFAPIDSTSGLSIIGNYQQQGFLFSFDVGRSILGIQPNVC